VCGAAGGTARRYHWLGHRLNSFVNEPCDARRRTLNPAGRREPPSPSSPAGRDLLERLPQLVLPQRHGVTAADINPRYVKRILLKTYEKASPDFEALFGIEGVSAKTLRALALVAVLIYGTHASTHDPARFSFAHGDKDGTPYPVARSTYDRTIDVLNDALKRAKVDRNDKLQALKRLAAFGQTMKGR